MVWVFRGVWYGSASWFGVDFCSLVFFFFGQLLVCRVNTSFFISITVLVDVPAAVQIGVGVDVCEADEPWPRGCPVLTVTSCALGAAPVSQQPNTPCWEHNTALLPCCCLSSRHLLCALLGLSHHRCPGSSHKANRLSPSALQKHVCRSEVY